MTKGLSVKNVRVPLRNVANFSTLVEKMIERDHHLPGLACYFGPSGWGKSQSAIQAANDYRAAYVEMGQYTSPRDMLGMILQELGEQQPRGTIEKQKNRAIELMAGDPRRPLIVDEAHFVAGKRFVDLLRELSDKAGATVILIGEEMLPQALERFERVHNRVLEWLPALPCDEGDFAMLVQLHCDGIKVAGDLGRAILDRTRGNTRRVSINLAKVREIAHVNGLDKVDLDAFGGVPAIITSSSPQPRKVY